MSTNERGKTSRVDISFFVILFALVVLLAAGFIIN